MESIDGVIINQKDLLSPFLCDVSKCRGACCFIEGEFGAPLSSHELPLIEKYFPKVQHLLPERSLQVIEKNGYFLKQNGAYYTNVVDGKECVFAYFKNDVARCSFETVYNNGLSDFRKPISCHLFPLREYKFFRTELVYFKLKECIDAIENGKQKNISLIESVKEALIRRFGKEWVDNLLHFLSLTPSKNNIGGKK